MGTVKRDSLFGQTELDKGSVATVVSGSLAGIAPETLLVRFEGPTH